MTDAAPHQICFDTAELPERDRFPAFCEGIFRHVVGADVAQQEVGPFSGSLDVRRAGVVGIIDISISAASIARQANHIGDGDDAIVVQFWRQGRACMTQGKYEIRVEPGDGLTIDNAKPAKICIEGASRFRALIIPRNSIVALNPRAIGGVGAKPTENGAFRLLYAYLKEITAECFMDAASARMFGNHLIDLAALALGGDHSALAQTHGVRAARRSAILSEIADRSGDPGLSATAIAQRLGITLRYVHLLLEETGKSFTRHVFKKAA